MNPLVLIKPIVGLFSKRQERKLLREKTVAALSQSAQDNKHQININKDEWESLNVKTQEGTWKDEYVTVSLVSILNLIVLGGILTAFGFPQVLTGVGVAVNALGEAGVDVGFLLKAAVLAGLGLSVWKSV